MNKSLKFLSMYVEKLYKEYYINDHILMYRLIIGFIWIILTLWTIFEVTILYASMEFVVIRILLNLAFSVVLLLVFFEAFKRHYVAFTTGIICASLLIMFSTNIGYNRLGALSTAIVPAITYILFNVDWV